MNRAAWAIWLTAAFAFGVAGGPFVPFPHITTMPGWLGVAFPAGLLGGWLVVPRRRGGISSFAMGWCAAYLAGLWIAEAIAFDLLFGSLLMVMVGWVLALFVLLMSLAGLWLGTRLPPPAWLGARVAEGS